MYEEDLPRAINIKRLAKNCWTVSFDVITVIERVRAGVVDEFMIDFLKLFSVDKVLGNAEDLLTSSEELKFLIREAYKTPKESLLSPQD